MYGGYKGIYISVEVVHVFFADSDLSSPLYLPAVLKMQFIRWFSSLFDFEAGIFPFQIELMRERSEIFIANLHKWLPPSQSTLYA